MDNEYELRLRAIDLAEAGWSTGSIAQELDRSSRWVRKWVRRYETGGETGLEDRSRRPKHSPNRLSEPVRVEILRIRAELKGHRHANVGAKAIRAKMRRTGTVDEIPSIASIKRVLKDAGVTRTYRTKHRSTKSVLGLPTVTRGGIWQQADWVQDRYLPGAVKYQSLQISDAGSDMVSSDQYYHRTIYNAVHQLTGQAWPTMSIPYATGTDNAFARSSHRDIPWTLWVKILLMFGVEVIVSPPNTLGFTNHVENINGLWQDRTINRWHYNTLEELRADTARFVDWANNERSILNEDIYNTEYPAEHIANITDQLRWLPDGFDLDTYIGPGGTNTLPLAKGRVTFLRHIDEHHTITIAQHHWHVPNSLPQGALVIAGIDTATGQLTIRHQGDTVWRHRYPMETAVLDPIHPATQTGLLDHLPPTPNPPQPSKTGTMS
ncbi:MAG: helix-turn-helix domain-containing protein [Actinomycetota bacterium]|nr:helix-turn-helix domain-containing protein [Actinomycetota bacterium]